MGGEGRERDGADAFASRLVGTAPLKTADGPKKEA